MKKEPLNLTFEQYVTRAEVMRPKYVRRGQNAFNLLCTIRPDLAEKVRATPLDPFYRDEILPDFYTFVGENW